MRRILFDILEVNIAVSIVIVLVCLLEEKLRKRYGASWLKIVWFVLAVRLLIPYNFSLPFTELRFFNAPGFEQEENGFGVSPQGTADTGQEAVSGTEVPENLGQNSFQDVQESINISSEMQETESEGSGLSVQGSNSTSASGIIQVDQSVTEQKKPSSVELGITQNEHTAVNGNTSQNNQTGYAQNNQLSATQDTEQDSQSSAMQGMEQNGQSSIMQGQAQNNLPASSQNGMVSELSIGQKAVQDNHASYSDILVVVWLLGIGASILYFGLSNIGFYMNCRKTLQPYTESVVLKHVNHLQERILGSVKLGVYQSSAITSPMLVGLVKPKLVLPMQKQPWEKKELEYIVAHELCHYRNKDLWLKLLMMFSWCLNWFNPLVFLMKKKCFFHIELACDGCVLEGMEPEIRIEYAGMLLTFAGRKQEVSAFSTNFGDSKKRMKQRIDYALDNRSRKKGIGSLVMVGIVLAASCLLISCGYKPNEVGVNELEPGQNKAESGSQVGQQTEQVAGQGVRPTEVPGKPTEETKGAGESKPTGEAEITKEPVSTEEPAVTPIEDRKAVPTEEYKLVYEDINMFRSGTTGSYFKYGDTYADLYMRRLQDDTREHIELSLWAPQQEIWHTDNGDDMEAYVDAYPLFWQEDSKNLTLEQRQCYYVVESDGTVYIMRYCVENTSNAITMSYKVFGVSCNIESPYYFLGNEVVYDADSISVYLVKDSDIDSDVSFPIEQLLTFADRVKGYMENGHMVASTVHGAFEFGISPDGENTISPYLYDIFPWIPELVTQHGINLEGIDSPKKLLTALQNALPVEDSVMMPDIAADGSYFITGDYYSDSDRSYLTVRRKEDGSYEGSLFIDNALVIDITGYYDNGILTAMEIVNYPEQLPCEMEISFQNGNATLTITAASEWSYPLQVGDTLTLDRDEKPEEFEYLRNAEYLANETNVSNTSGNNMEATPTGYNWYTYGTQLYTIPEAELGLKEHAVWMRYKEAAERGVVVEYPGTLPGATEGVWCCVTVDGVEYIYGRYDEQERYELYAYAFVGEECVLGNGLHVGMTREEVLKLCPGIADAILEEQEGYDMIWSSSCYPKDWEEKYDYAMILDVDDGIAGNKMTYLALMMKGDVVCAMTPYVPITDGMVLPENPKEACD